MPYFYYWYHVATILHKGVGSKRWACETTGSALQIARSVARAARRPLIRPVLPTSFETYNRSVYDQDLPPRMRKQTNI